MNDDVAVVVTGPLDGVVAVVTSEPPCAVAVVV
jgi:hypothetical protein